MTYPVFLFIAFAAFFSGCKNATDAITKSSDYNKYLKIASADSMPALKKINTDISFWSDRLARNPGDAVAKVSLAGLYSARFKTGADINDIHTSDSLYVDANTLFKTNTSSVYRSLAANCLTRHKFQQAKLNLDTALLLGDDKYLTYLMRCDVFMELGYADLAEESLKRISGKNNFDYLIREAKLLDHKGDLDGAIKKMELAAKKAVESKKDALILWAKSNLGDLYGHANRFRESYQCYLDVLAMKPDYLYALRGIAWLAFSHDKNTGEAKRIVNYLSKLQPVPDYDLLLAGIAAYEKDSSAKEELLEKFVTVASGKQYGDMYNKYLFNLMIEEYNDEDKALQIAKLEVDNRPTPQSYDLLAWAHYNMGKKADALKIAKTFVENRNFEPEALYHLGMIYAAIGNNKKAKHYLEQARDASFELGPGLAARIEQDFKAIVE
jgi:tetratricopeptide (TPR) repeat protein